MPGSSSLRVREKALSGQKTRRVWDEYHVSKLIWKVWKSLFDRHSFLRSCTKKVLLVLPACDLVNAGLKTGARKLRKRFWSTLSWGSQWRIFIILHLHSDCRLLFQSWAYSTTTPSETLNQTLYMYLKSFSFKTWFSANRKVPCMLNMFKDKQNGAPLVTALLHSATRRTFTAVMSTCCRKTSCQCNQGLTSAFCLLLSSENLLHITFILCVCVCE